MPRAVLTAAEQQRTRLRQGDAVIDTRPRLIKRLVRQQLGRRSEQGSADQGPVALEGLAQTVAAHQAAPEAAGNKRRQRRETRPNRPRGALPAPLPR